MYKNFLQTLDDILSPDEWTNNPDDISPYTIEERGLFSGKASILLKPSNSLQVQKIIKFCSEKNISLVPQGGRTGLCGGTVPSNDGKEVLLSLEKLNKIHKIDPTNFSMLVDSGCVLANIQKAAISKNRFFPLSLASEGSCTIGGNLSTNAGGINVLRYGMTRDLVMGLQIVMPDGSILNRLSDLRKDNRGYDLKQLFIGAEGTLGIITKINLKLFPLPKENVTCLVAIKSPLEAINFFSYLREKIGEVISAFELINKQALSMVLKNISGVIKPFEKEYNWYILFESSWMQPNGLKDIISKILNKCVEDNIIFDAIIAESIQQSKNLWKLRESISESQKYEGDSLKHDISVPINKVDEFIKEASNEVIKKLPGARIVTFGHIGDGNIHFNISQPINFKKGKLFLETNRINNIVFDIVHKMHGSFSAEHGIGILKRNQLQKYNTKEELNLMKKIKTIIDPKNILNPKKIL